MNIQEGLKKLKASREELKQHPLAFDVKEKANGTLVVLMPYSLQGVNGIQISENISKTKKYELAIIRLERLWQEDSIFYSANK